MIEVQCPSCQTRYRIDESVLPQDSPTFKCSRCGHVFSGDPRLTRRAPIAKPKPAPQPPRSAPPPQAAAPSAPPPAPAPVAPEVQEPTPSPRAASADLQFTQPPPASPQRSGSSAELQPAAPPPPQMERPGPSADLQPPQRAPSAEVPRAEYPTTPQAATPVQRPAPARTAAAPSARAPVPAEPERDNPLARSFADEEGKPPENLSFDFSDDPAEQHQLGEAAEPPAEPEDRYDRWQVGDPDAEAAPAPRMTSEIGRYQARRAAIAQAARRAERPAPAPEAEEHDRMRSSSFFVALFALIVIAFGALTFILGISPSLSRGLLAHIPVIGDEFTAAAPRPGAVLLHDVRAEYRVLDSRRHALIVSGQAENRGDEPLHAIQIGVSLTDGNQRPVLSQSVFCGDLVSPGIVSQMTPHELQFFQKLTPPKNFVLKSGASTPFFVMFVNPPPNATNFQVSILKAEPAAGDSSPSTGI